MKRMVLVLSHSDDDNRRAREALERISAIVEIAESESATRSFEEMDLPLPALVYEPRRGGGGAEFGLESIETFVEHALEELEPTRAAVVAHSAHSEAH